MTTPRGILNKPSRSPASPPPPESIIPSDTRNPYRLRAASCFHHCPGVNLGSSAARGQRRPRHISLSLLVLLLAAVLLPAPGGNSQLAAATKPLKKEYALIFGTVWGPDNRPVYGVPVKIRRAQDKKPKWEVYSDHHGEFAQRVPPGEADYILTADLKGVKTADGKPLHLVSEVKVHVDYDEREDTGLHLAQ